LVDPFGFEFWLASRLVFQHLTAANPQLQRVPARPCSAEDSAVVATALLNNWLARVKTPALLDCIVEFLLVCTSKPCAYWWKIMRAVIFSCEQHSAAFLDAAASSRFF
jgi:hypothetical protein